ncbi:hypothetical protein [Pseudoalteromonas luteoviolacea]|uniref:Carboxypeptidase regulatory-like domain-containing protein n=1 Tax=Pseudoalteromonas luteoviolacea NCIMB 1942 TaxID=1365253 RepID=A0A167AQ09_9GAMM|nr:hypothetical protein [Pseudoalteromonas luteoviolacea]KZN45665.1 hypothetical protein N482_14040 [Pseudoalteromonas luteoviolacea NCIMB 1942]
MRDFYTVFVWLILVSLLAGKVTDLRAAPVAFKVGVVHAGGARIAVGEDLLLSLYINEAYIAEVFAIKTEHGAAIELQSLFSSLDFAISAQNTSASTNYVGWFIAPKQSFSLDLEKQRAHVAGRVEHFNNYQWRQLEGETYVDANLLASWFNLKFIINYQDLRVQVLSAKVLPIEQRLARKSRTFSMKNTHPLPILPWQPSPYQKWSAPLLDFQLGVKATDYDTKLDYVVQGSQDIAYWNTHYFVRGSEQDLASQSRLQASRSYSDAVSLGPLEVTQLEFGDIIGTHIGRDYQATHARGARVTNRPVYKEVDSQIVRISGGVQVGWDVELYHNGLMIAQQLNIQSGLYDFDNIELYFGSNAFEILMYGPQGQIAQDVRSYYVTGNAIKAGEHYFDMSIVDTGSTLLNDKLVNLSTSGWNLLSRYDYGLSENVAVYTGVRYGLESQANQYQLSTGVSFDMWNRGLLNVDLSRDEQGNQLTQLQGRTEVNGHSLSMTFNDRNRFLTPQSISKVRSQELYLRASGQFYSYGSLRLNYQNTLNWQRTQQQNRFMATNLLAMATRAGTFSNQLSYFKHDTDDETELFGGLRWQGRLGRAYGRFNIGYQLQPSRKFTDYQIQISQSIQPDLDVELEYTKSLLHDGYELGVGLSWHNDRLRLTGDFSYQQNEEWQLGFATQFSLGYPNTREILLFTDKRLASTGSVAVKVFLDHNNNAVFDKNDEVLQGVRIKSVQSLGQAQTDDNGIALLTNMPLERRTDIRLDIDTLPDPFYIPAHDGRSVTPRRGLITYLEYPVVHAGELEGVTYRKHLDGSSSPLPYATIELVDKDNKVVAQAKSAFDGYYVLSNIRPGLYEARVKQQSDDEFTQRGKVAVQLSNEGDVLLEVDLTVEQLEQRERIIASGGRFNSLPILKTYALMLVKKSPGLFQSKPFYMYDRQREDYLLGFSLYEHVEKAAKACLTFKRKKINCEVEEITLNY